MTPLLLCVVRSRKISFWGLSEAGEGLRISGGALSKGSISRPVKRSLDSATAGPLSPAFVWTHPRMGLVCLVLVARWWERRLGGQTQKNLMGQARIGCGKWPSYHHHLTPWVKSQL